MNDAVSLSVKYSAFFGLKTQISSSRNVERYFYFVDIS